MAELDPVFDLSLSPGMVFCFLQRTLRSSLRCRTVRFIFAVVVFTLLVFALNARHRFELERGWWTLDAFFVSPMDATDRALLDRTLRAFVKGVEGANVTYFMTGGTLTGSLRHLGRIPWDDDVDVLVDANDKVKLSGALAQFDPDYGVYVTGLDLYHWQWKFYPTNGRFVFHCQYRTPYIDIFFYLENRTHVWNASPIWSGSELWPKRHIFPLTRRPYGNLSLPAPCDALGTVGRSVDISVCRGRTFSHLLEIPFLSRPISIPCVHLEHLYPFVKRKTKRNGTSVVIRESLIFRNRSIKEFTVHQSC